MKCTLILLLTSLLVTNVLAGHDLPLDKETGIIQPNKTYLSGNSPDFTKYKEIQKHPNAEKLQYSIGLSEEELIEESEQILSDNKEYIDDNKYAIDGQVIKQTTFRLEQVQCSQTEKLYLGEYVSLLPRRIFSFSYDVVNGGWSKYHNGAFVGITHSCEINLL